MTSLKSLSDKPQDYQGFRSISDSSRVARLHAGQVPELYSVVAESLAVAENRTGHLDYDWRDMLNREFQVVQRFPMLFGHTEQHVMTGWGLSGYCHVLTAAADCQAVHIGTR